MEWTTALSLGSRVATEGYRQRGTIQQWWTKAKAYIDKGATQILITGHSAVGKSMLAAQMHGRARDLAFRPPSVSRHVEVEAVTLEQWSKLLRVLPGQAIYSAVGEMQHMLNNDSLEGIIHVVDYGFTLPRDPAIAATLLEIDDLDTIEKLRQKNLRDEVERIKLLFNDLRRMHKQNQAPQWVVIVVNKIDLFPDQEAQALRHYHPAGDSLFSQEVQAFLKDVGQTNLPVHFAKVCAWENDFVWNGQTVKSNLPRQAQMETLETLMQLIAELSEVRS
ncbi:MAG: hypothetical protein RL761_1566 [Pseudomonadota bacterium]|jgi:hypothetical protein